MRFARDRGLKQDHEGLAIMVLNTAIELVKAQTTKARTIGRSAHLRNLNDAADDGGNAPA